MPMSDLQSRLVTNYKTSAFSRQFKEKLLKISISEADIIYAIIMASGAPELGNKYEFKWSKDTNFHIFWESGYTTNGKVFFKTTGNRGLTVEPEVVFVHVV